MRRILVTGGAGYIGSHTCKALAHADFEPVTFDNLSTGRRELVKWGPLVEADLDSPQSVRDAIERYSPVGVIHFGASAYVRESMFQPRKYFRNNVQNSLNLMDAMADCGVDNIVFSSTCATYGLPQVLPIPESHPQSPINPYGESKLFVERALGWYNGAYGLNSLVLRYFNAAGADKDGETGEVHDPETHLIPLAIAAALGSGPALSIHGTDYPTSDGTCIRDYIHVSDLAHAHVLAMRALLNRELPNSTAINLGTGTGHSVRDVIQHVEEITGRRVPITPSARRAGDPAVLFAASSAPSLLGWAPEYPRLREIVESACRWYMGPRLQTAEGQKPFGRSIDSRRPSPTCRRMGSLIFHSL